MPPLQELRHRPAPHARASAYDATHGAAILPSLAWLPRKIFSSRRIAGGVYFSRERRHFDELGPQAHHFRSGCRCYFSMRREEPVMRRDVSRPAMAATPTASLSTKYQHRPENMIIIIAPACLLVALSKGVPRARSTVRATFRRRLIFEFPPARSAIRYSMMRFCHARSALDDFSVEHVRQYF